MRAATEKLNASNFESELEAWNIEERRKWATRRRKWMARAAYFVRFPLFEFKYWTNISIVSIGSKK